jgi:hypothetical protein
MQLDLVNSKTITFTLKVSDPGNMLYKHWLLLCICGIEFLDLFLFCTHVLFCDFIFVLMYDNAMWILKVIVLNDKTHNLLQHMTFICMLNLICVIFIFSGI